MDVNRLKDACRKRILNNQKWVQTSSASLAELVGAVKWCVVHLEVSSAALCGLPSTSHLGAIVRVCSVGHRTEQFPWRV